MGLTPKHSYGRLTEIGAEHQHIVDAPFERQTAAKVFRMIKEHAFRRGISDQIQSPTPNWSKSNVASTFS